MIYVCSICGFIYDEKEGAPDYGIAPNTKFSDLGDDFRCPWCGASKEDFVLQGGEESKEESKDESKNDAKENTISNATNTQVNDNEALRNSIICSNLKKGLEKQALLNDAKEFDAIIEYFNNRATYQDDKDLNDVMKLIDNELNNLFVDAEEAAKENNDRGSKRALLWASKNTKMIKSLIMKYQNGYDFNETNLYVCSACGFIYAGDKAPDICPVCKVPSYKFIKIEGEK